MKKIFSILIILACFASTTFAQHEGHNHKHEKATEKATEIGIESITLPGETPAEGGPIMTFESTEVDYGEIEQHADPLRKFIFTNTGDSPLQITHAKGSCGCTVPTWPKAPIFPGEQGEIEVRYDTKRIGKFVKRVTLTTNEGSEKRVLTIKGTVNKKAEEPEGVPASNSILAPGGGK